MAGLFGLVLVGCRNGAAEDLDSLKSSGSGNAADSADLRDGPELVVDDSDPAELVRRWQEFEDSAVAVDEIEARDSIAGITSIGRPWFVLADGRYLVAGRWDEDDPIPSWNQQNPDALPPDEPAPPVVETTDRPIRLFVVDDETGVVQPVSDIPAVHPYSTAVSIGEGPDVVLDAVVLEGQETLAYTLGFNGAGYDVSYGVFVAPIPPP